VDGSTFGCHRWCRTRTQRRAPKGSIVDEPRIRAVLKEFPDMPATVSAERIGWDRSMTVLKERVPVR
jgi:hypothetical protein